MHFNIRKSFKKLRKINKKYALIGASILAFFLFIGGVMSSSTPSEQNNTTSEIPELIEVFRIGDSETRDSLSTIGTVEAESETELRAQTTGEVVAVRTQIGETLRAGSIVAVIENSSEQAAVAQAQAGVDQARASLNKLIGGTREQEQNILNANVEAAEEALKNERTAAVVELRGAYSEATAIVRSEIDVLFSNASGVNPHFRYSAYTNSSSKREKVESLRSELRSTLLRWENFSEDITESNLELSLNTVENYVEDIISLTDELVSLTRTLRPDPQTGFTQDDIAAVVEASTGARNSANVLLSSLTSLSTSLQQAKTSLKTARERADLGVEGAQEEDIAAAQANLESAEANLQAAVARLEKTIIRSPITGQLVSLSIRRGDVVTALQSIGFVSNQSNLSVATSITQGEQNLISIGDDVRIEGTISGTVTRIAPGIDPVTGRVEVVVSVTEENPSLVSGESVTLEISTNSELGTTPAGSQEILIPLTALKVTPEYSAVFIVNSEMILEERRVETGTLRGESIVITDGIRWGETIARDARGLEAGQTVETTN